jgi:hypothetical protein
MSGRIITALAFNWDTLSRLALCLHIMLLYYIILSINISTITNLTAVKDTGT